jgi:tRNA (cmo5U34)-methyltransferase
MYVWKNSVIVENFLNNTRKAIPFGEEQLDILLRLVINSQSEVRHFIDLGCGDGILASVILAQYPKANGLLIDYSDKMIESAKSRLGNCQNQRIINADISNSNWINTVIEKPEVIVSGFAIHHLKNSRKYELFEEVYSLLKPNGIFINVEHVRSASFFGNNLFDELVVDTLYEKLKNEGKEKSKALLITEHKNRPDQFENILIPVTTQCDWLREIGFQDVDCFFKCFELSVYAGIKP